MRPAATADNTAQSSTSSPRCQHLTKKKKGKRKKEKLRSAPDKKAKGEKSK